MTTPFETDDRWEERLSEYVDGLLSPSETRELEAHLETCERCRKSVAELRTVVERLRSDRVDPVPEDTWPRIRNLLTEETVATRRSMESRYPAGIEIGTLRKIAAAAALIVTFAAGAWAGITLSLTAALSTSPGWLTTISHKLHIPSRPQPLPYAADSIPAEWIPLQRSVAELDRELASARVALGNAPGNERLQRVVQQLTRERDAMRSVLDSVAHNRR